MVNRSASLHPQPIAHAPLGQALAFGMGALLILVAPLMRGGNRGVALILLEGLALAVLLCLALAWAQGARDGWGTGKGRWGLVLLAGAPLWIALLQLTPLPPALWEALPGRAFYQGLLSNLGIAAPGWRPASLTPDATRVSVLAGLPIVACFALGLSCTREQLRVLMRLWIASALLQALLGLAQLGSPGPLHFGSLFTGVIGTFANSNHLAGFLAMMLPLGVMELQRALREGDHQGKHLSSAGWLWGLALFVMVTAVLAGQSRTGLVTAVLVTVGALLLLPGQWGHRISWRWRLGALVLAVLLAFATVGLKGLQRFEGAVLSQDASVRQLAFDGAWAAAREFWPAGSGLGSFAVVYPRFQPAATGNDFVEHAHSDYVQLLMETGLPGVLLGAVALALALAQAARLGKRIVGRHSLRSEEQYMLVAGLGLVALLLHAWVDFNMRIPALAMLGAFLFGVFLRPRAGQRDI